MRKTVGKIIGLLILVVFASACTTPTVTEVTSIATVPQIPTSESDTDANPSEIAITKSTETVETTTDQEEPVTKETNQMNIQIGNTVLTATLVDNSSADALKEALLKGPITINMRDYGSMEKVGPLGMDLPRNDQQITTGAGDIILYQGNSLVIYYAPNSWNFTRLGKVNDITAEELRGILGDGDVVVTLSLSQE